MVGKRRFGLLYFAVFVGLAVLYARLFQVQVVEHEVWAQQAANLVRSASLLPYHRGRILDAHGRPMAYDDDYYQVELVYRDFRRGHPLGQVAHARSSLELRPVPLDEALASFEDQARALVELTPNALAAFGRGEALELPGLHVPAVEDPAAERRGARSADVHYYVANLLLHGDSKGGERRRIWRTRGEPAGDRSFLELAALELRVSREQVEAELERRLRDARSDLTRLGVLLGCGDETGEPPLLALVRDLEAARHDIEDAIADELFREATRFPAGRLATASLARIDCTWIARVLAWDEARLAEWIATRREGWLEWARTFGLQRGLLQIELSYEVGHPAQRLLTELAVLFSADPPPALGRAASDWRGVDALACVRELPDLFAVPEADRVAEQAALRLPFQDPELRARARGAAEPWELLAHAAFDPARTAPVWLEGEEEPWIAPRSEEELEARWRSLAENGRLHADEALRLATLHFDAWEEALQRAFADALDLLGEHALVPRGAPLPIAEARRSAALKKARHVVRDQSSRPALVDRAPDYGVVQLVTRWHERYAGIEVRTRTRRRNPAVDPNGVPLAQGLLGSVREVNLREVLSQRGRRRELRELQRKRERTPAEDRRVLELASELHHPEEHQGGSGLEGYLDEELRGRNGYVETQGLEERSRSGEVQLYELPVDGVDVRLTLDLDLQAAAQAVLEHPELPAWEESPDRTWFENPVGAIVLLTPEGDVLAAASVPTREAEAPPGRDGERAFVRERTLTRPWHQAPGSVFKPFVALWALENLGFDARTEFDCASLPDGGAGYESMHCHSSRGHGLLDLHGALLVSCNAYFAQLGELYDPDELVFMAEEFGFGQPTGIRSLDGSRGGIREDARADGLQGLLDPKQSRLLDKNRRQVANGLGLIEATPAQVARAMCGLLTNRLPELRLIAAIDGEPVPRRARELGFRGEHLMRIHEALDAVVNTDSGSAWKGIGSTRLPFRVAGKTGSADYRAFAPGTEPGNDGRANKKRRKHTWFGGWFPVEEPRAVLVVYLHDVSETSGHTSVHVARQFLGTPAVRAFLGAE